METLPSVKIDEKYKDVLIDFKSSQDIPSAWRQTPIETFIMAQNFGWPIQTSGKPELLISTCIEFRYALPIPRMYAYVIRRASGRVIGSEFSVGYTLAKGVNHLVMIGHNDCGMTKLDLMAPLVVNAYTEQGWSKQAAEEYVKRQASRHAIREELEALKEEHIRMHQLFPKMIIAPLFVCLYDCKLYLPKWYKDLELSDNQSSKASVPDELIRNLP